ncbi:MAG: M12 family metallo-peptidase [Bacteroidota bacterium]|nr:M12 family metallo-peptidase [Bacteroidota bacterium]
MFQKRSFFLIILSLAFHGLLSSQNYGNLKSTNVDVSGRENAKPIPLKVVKIFEQLNIDPVKPFKVIKTSHEYESSLSSATVIEFNQVTYQKILFEKPDFVQIAIPGSDRNDILLDLIKVDLKAEGFKVTTSKSNGQPVETGEAVYYRGIIHNELGSIAAISLFENQVYGMISIDGVNTVIQPLPSKTGEFIIYQDKDILVDIPFNCQVEDPGVGGDDDDPNPQFAVGDCIRVYLECDYALNQNKGGVNNTVAWITSVFNNVSTLYSNESINTTISEVFVWTTLDTYSRSDAYLALTQFRNLRGTFNGDLAHLAALGGTNIGGVAWLDVLCSSYKYAYSNITSTYANVPTYSWTVEVLTHEMGHNIGSNHTQWCGWTGGAIDNCYTPEGTCSPGPAPTNGGTIMSYCHLTQYGINFNNGFGSLPGTKIRNEVAAATCLGRSCSGDGGCPVPTGLAASNITQTTATLSWAAAAGAVSYDFEYKLNTAQTWTLINRTNTSVNLTGLTAASLYNTRVRTRCQSANSAYSAVVNFTTLGTGTCGVPTNLAVTNITSSTATASWTLVVGATSYNFQYKLATSGNWSQLNVITTNVNLTGMTPSTAYNVRVQSVCGAQTSAFGPVVNFTTLPASSYCNSKGNSTSFEWIKRVKLGTIDRTSASDGGYYNGTGLSTDISIGTTYTLNYQAGMNGGAHRVYWRAWIDFNRNGVFTDVGEQILSTNSTSTGLLAISFTVPAGSSVGASRIRVSMKYGGYPSPCETFSYGEVEDYSVNIKAAGTLPGNIINSDQKILNAQVFPNPFNQNINLQLNSSVKGDIEIKVIDLLGRTRLLLTNSVEIGQNEIGIDTESLMPSNYTLLIRSGDELIYKKIVKIN